MFHAEIEATNHGNTCDHVPRGEHTLGDLMAEPLEIMLRADSHPLESGAGGRLPEWIYDIYRKSDETLPEATPSLRWLYDICRREDRLDRLVNRLLRVEKDLQNDLAEERRKKREWRTECRRLRTRLEELQAVPR